MDECTYFLYYQQNDCYGAVVGKNDDRVMATIAKYKEGGAPRFYMLYDQAYGDWAIMTYVPNRKNMLTYRRLVQMGKWKATRYFKDVADIKAGSFYYTPSKWGAIGCDEDNKVREAKLKQWQEYYMFRVSTVMRKLRKYKKNMIFNKQRNGLYRAVPSINIKIASFVFLKKE